MKYQDLRDHIIGSHLMKHHLEAFLIQSAYLEGLIKLYVDFNFFIETDSKSFDNKFLGAVKKDLEKSSLNNLLSLLSRAELLSKEQQKLLNDYRLKRNKVLHDLLTQVASLSFENELIEVYEIGKKITDSEDFKSIENILDGVEEKRLANTDK